MSARTPITFSQLERKIRWLVEVYPDYVYPKVSSRERVYACVYNETHNQPACIFGRAFQELGYPVPDSFEGEAISAVLYHMLDTDTEPLNSAKIMWADTLQIAQDSDEPWREGLTKADEARANFKEKR